MVNDLKILELLKNNEEVFLFDDFEEVVIKFVGNKAFAKRKGKEPYELNPETNLVYNARLGGKIITKEEFDNY